MDEKPLEWVGSSKRDLMGFPEDVKDEAGHALGLAQNGQKYIDAKRMQGIGPGVFEIVSNGKTKKGTRHGKRKAGRRKRRN